MGELWTPQDGIWHSQAPPSLEHLVPISPEQEIYESFKARIEGFSSFEQRPFAEAREDFVATMHEAATPGATDPKLNLWPLDLRRSVIQRLISPGSYEALGGDVADYWAQYEIEKRLADRSIVIFINHRAFSDVPVASVVVSDVRQADPFAVQRNVQVVGRMIPGMKVDMFGTGEFVIVTDVLRQAGRQLQTVPSPKGLSDRALEQRGIWNDESKETLANLLGQPGNIILIAASGTHDQVEGDQLVMQHVNRETIRLLVEAGVDVIPLFFSCLSFSPTGLVAANAKYRLLPPRTFESHEDGLLTMLDLAAAGSDVLADEFSAVVYAESFADKSGRLTREVGQRVVQRLTDLRHRHND